jgi:hypothetical protein
MTPSVAHCSKVSRSADNYNELLYVAGDPNTPPEVLEQLIPDAGLPPLEKSISKVLTLEILEVVTGNPLKILVEKLKYYAAHSEPFSCLASLLHPLTPATELQNAGITSFWWERYAIAQNPNTPAELIQALSEDPNCLVRAAAKANL